MAPETPHNKPSSSPARPSTVGRVFLVGAGPGDPGLITVRGQELIRQADVIAYDRLVPERLLTLAHPQAETIYVGKLPGDHPHPQQQINEILIDRARRGKQVVRLKGGDPYIFGRGGEEALALHRAGITFEVVPGVTAAVAAAAYAGIPITMRHHASEVAFVTGQEDPSRTGDSHIDWDALGRWQGTLVFYMAVNNLAAICDRLIEHGKSGKTPAALVRWATVGSQKCLTAPLAEIAALALRSAFDPPAVLLIGSAVDFHDQLNWFERLPLFGRRIVATRSRTRASELTDRLGSLGADVIEFPTIRIEPACDLQPLRDAVARLQQYQWIVFTSVNGVDAFFAELTALGRDARALAQAGICAIGSVTADRLTRFGITADVIPPRFVAEALVEELQKHNDLTGKHILLPRSDIARADLPVQLRRLGAVVDEITAYRTIPDTPAKDQLVQALEADSIDWITFTSSSTVRSFFEQIDPAVLTGKKCRLAGIGPITSQTIRKSGLNVDAEPTEHTIAALTQAVIDACGPSDP